MTRAPLILSTGIADPRLSDPVWASEFITLAEQARVDMLLLGDGRAAPFDPLVVASWMASLAPTVGLVPTLDTGRDLPSPVARALSALNVLTQGRLGWQPSTLTHPTTKDSVPRGVDFVAATRSLLHGGEADALIIDQESDQQLDHAKVLQGEYSWVGGCLNAALPPQCCPVLVQTEADALWSQVAADVVIIDMDSGRPPPGPKCLLRTFTAMAGLDEIEQLYHDGIIDGIHLAPPNPRRGLQEFIDTMLPALFERSLIPEARQGGTLRERLHLSAPAHGFHPTQVDCQT